MGNEMVKIFSTSVSNPEFEKGLTEWRIKIQNFTKKMNVTPPADNVRSKQGIPYLPVSIIETTLDELFFGQWSTKNFSYTQIANEIVGTIELEVLHPTSGMMITRTGSASVQIMQDKGATIDSIIQTKKKNALETGFPKLKAMCLKNAALSLGKAFGRDLARKQKDVGHYNGLAINTGDWREALEIINNYEGEDKESIRTEALGKRASCQLTDEYVAELKERCSDNS